MSQRNFQPKHRTVTSRSFNGRRDIDRMYDTKWEEYRKRFLAVNPKCYACNEYAIVVDHLIPHKGDEKLFKKLDNHIQLCVKCHNTVTTKFDRDYRPGNPVTKKIEWLNRNRTEVGARVKVLPYY